MKVLLINSEHTRAGGAYTVYLNTGEMLRAAGIEVVYFALHTGSEIPCAQSEYFANPVNQSSPVKYVVKRFYNRNAAKCLQKLIDAEHPDVAQAHLMWGSLAPSILEVLRRNRIPVIHTVHDFAMVCSKVVLKSSDGKVCERCAGGKACQSIKTKCHNGSFLRSLIATSEFIYRNKYHHPVSLIDHFMFVSKFCADKHCEMDGRFNSALKSVIYNVPNEDFASLAVGSMPDTYGSYYLYYGRLSFEKGLHTLLEVFSRHPEMTLKVVGTGPLEKELKEKYTCPRTANGVTEKNCASGSIAAGEKECYENIQFLGYHSGGALAELVRSARFVCVPSECYENNPMTIVESYTLGTPVIASRIGGIPEIVEEGKTGYLFESGSKDGLEMALQNSNSLTKTEYQQMKEMAKKYSHEKFERDSYVDRLVELYDSVLKRNQR